MINSNPKILVVNDVEATRDSIEVLLRRDGYKIKTAKNEQEAATAARNANFDLLLISLDGEIEKVIESVRRIRQEAVLEENIPAIIFCPDDSEENEVAVESGIYLSCPENFDQLREFISRLLRQFHKTARI